MESAGISEATEAHPNYIPGDPELIDKMVFQLKLQGIFDEFRRDCLADVDTKPAYQNLRQRVDNSVQGFLNGTTWSASLNKKNVRENLRKHVYDCRFLDLGVERIVEQVVNPKIRSVFMPKVEQVVYQFLGIKVEPKSEAELNKWSSGIDKVKSGHIFSIKGEPFNLLPEELEPISPDHDVFSDNEDTKAGIKEKKESTKEIKENPKVIKEEDLSASDKEAKENDEISPEFEPHHPNKDEDSAASDLSGISDLRSLSGSPKQIDFSDFNKKIRKESTEDKLTFNEEPMVNDGKDVDLDETEPMIDASAISPLSSVGSVDDSPDGKVIFSFEKPFVETCASNSSIKSTKTFEDKFSNVDDDKTSDSDKPNHFDVNNRTPLRVKSPDVENTESSYDLKIHEDSNSCKSVKDESVLVENDFNLSKEEIDAVKSDEEVKETVKNEVIEVKETVKNEMIEVEETVKNEVIEVKETVKNEVIEVEETVENEVIDQSIVSSNDIVKNEINDENPYHHIDNDSLLLEYCHDQIEHSEDLSLPKTPTIHYENSNGSIEFESVGELKESLKNKSSTFEDNSITSFEDCLSKTETFKSKKLIEGSSPSFSKLAEESNLSLDAENSSASYKDNTGSDEISSKSETLKLYDHNSKEKDKKHAHHSRRGHSSRKDSHSSSKDHRKSHSSRSSSRDVKEGSSSKENKDSKSSRDHSSSKDSKESKSSKDSKESKLLKDSKDQKMSKDVKEVKSTKDLKASKDAKDHSSSKEIKDGKEVSSSRDGRESSSKDVRKHVSSKDHNLSSSKDRDKSKDSKNHHSSSKENKDSSKHSSKHHKSKDFSSKDSSSSDKDKSSSKDHNHHSSSKESQNNSDENKSSKEISKKSYSSKDEIKKSSSSSDKKPIEKSSKEHKKPEKINKDRKNKDQCSSMTVSRESRRSSDRDNDGSSSSSHRHSKSSHQLQGTNDTSRIDETSKKSHKSSQKQADTSSKQSDSNQTRTFIIFPVLKSSNSNEQVSDSSSKVENAPDSSLNASAPAETKVKDSSEGNCKQSCSTEIPSPKTPLFTFDKMPRIILKRCSLESYEGQHSNSNLTKSASSDTDCLSPSCPPGKADDSKSVTHSSPAFVGLKKPKIAADISEVNKKNMERKKFKPILDEADDSNDDENVEVDPEYLALINASESKTKDETALKKPKIAADLSQLRGKIKERKMFNKNLIKRKSEGESVTGEEVKSKRGKQSDNEEELSPIDQFEANDRNTSVDSTPPHDASESLKVASDKVQSEIKENLSISESHKLASNKSKSETKENDYATCSQDLAKSTNVPVHANQNKVKERAVTTSVDAVLSELNQDSCNVTINQNQIKVKENALNECQISLPKVKSEFIEDEIESKQSSTIVSNQPSTSEEKITIKKEQTPKDLINMDVVIKDEGSAELSAQLSYEELLKSDPKELFLKWRANMLSKLKAFVGSDILHLEQNSSLDNFINTRFVSYISNFEDRFYSELKELKINCSTEYFNFDSSLDSILRNEFNFIVERNSFVSVPEVSSAGYTYDAATDSYILKETDESLSEEQATSSTITKLKRKESDCANNENSLCSQSIPKKIKICGLTTGALQVSESLKSAAESVPPKPKIVAGKGSTPPETNQSEFQNEFATPSKSSAADSFDHDNDIAETSHLNESMVSPKYDPDSSIDDGSILNTPSKILTTQLIEPALESLLAESGLAPVRPFGFNLDSSAVNSDDKERIPFSLPLTPESDSVLTHVSPQKSNKRKSGESNSSSKKKPSPLSGKSTPPMKQRNALVESSMGKLQRYDNSDLYKPRPLFSQTSRRARTNNLSGRNSIGVENESDNSLNTGLIGKKR